MEAASRGLLDEKIEELERLLSPCMLCPRKCRAQRMAGELGYCRAPYGLVLSSAFPHFGEESPLVGRHGSGTIFLSHCNLKCVFCQNHEISIGGEGEACSYRTAAGLMLHLQERGCHNINLVTPTHYVPQILKALSLAAEEGLTIPLVYNCGGYESLDVIRLLEGIVDIYMPDIKFLDPRLSGRYCRAEDYPGVVREAVREMQRQVGDLVLDEEGVAARGLLIRHLVMPSCEEDSKAVLRFVRDEVSAGAYVNVMAQYHPCHRASLFPEINGRPSREAFREVVEFGRAIGLCRSGAH